MIGLDRLFTSTHWAASLTLVFTRAAIIAAGLFSAGAFSQDAQVVDISAEVARQQDEARRAALGEPRKAKVPKRLIRDVTYKVDIIAPTHKNKAGQMMGEADFAIDLRYYDTKDFKVKAYAEQGEVLILADVTGEPNLYQNDDKKWRWRADCNNSDPNYSHPPDTCHVGRWKKEHDEDPSGQDSAVASGRYWIKLVVTDKPAKGITIKVTNQTVFDDITIDHRINGELYEPGGSQIIAGQPNKMEFEYWGADGGKLPFTMYHGAMMHYVIFKPDLSQLAHVHPMYDMKNRKFTLMLNKAIPGDPNNKDLGNAVPDPGTYYVLTEIQPTIDKDRAEEAWFTRYQHHAPGTPPESTPLEVEVPDDYPYFDKYFTEDNKEGREGDYMRVRFTKIYNYTCFRWALQFQLFFSVWDGEKYVPLSSHHFGRWLMMPGHAIYIKENLDPRTQNSDLMFRYIAHSHSMNKPVMDGSGLLNYPVHTHGGSIPAGTYKIWFQTKLLGKVGTYPFVFEVKIPELDEGQNLPRKDVVQSFCAAPAFDNM